jgi:VRR-NUC domain
VRLNESDRFALLKEAKGFLKLPTKIKKPKVKATIKEKDLQSLAENLCIALGIRFFRIPDKLMGFLANYAPPWVRVFVARYFQGVPDLMLFKPIQGGDNVVRFIEIKTEVGKVSQGQSKWHSGLNVHVCYGWEQTEKAIREFE